MNDNLYFRNNKDIKLSKTLSWLLRHGAIKEGLTISADGYIFIKDILQHKSFKGKYNFTDIKRVVNNDNKKRYKLRFDDKQNVYEIKANQGHFIKEVNDTELTPILEPKYKTVVHGTYLANWRIIQREGLSRMKRNHIHFAKGTFSDPNIKSGIRKDIQIYIYIDLETALADGLRFFESENGVILTEGNKKVYLEPKYFLKVTNRSGVQIYP